MKKSKYSRRIIITGGAGFIGSNFLNYVVPKYPNNQFINIDKLTYAADLKNITVHNYENYSFEKEDILYVEGLTQLFEKYQATDIIHFAAESHVDKGIANPRLCVETNIIGTHNLLELHRDYNLGRFHLVSTDEVYGSLNLNDNPFTEESSYNPRNLYSASKASAELLTLSYVNTYDTDVVITRSSNNYGPNQDRTKLIPKFITNILNDKKVPLYATGENVRDWLFVTDNVRAIDLVFREAGSGSVYNIGGKTERTNMEITKTLLNFLNKDEDLIDLVPDRLGHDFRYALSNKKIETDLGWKPEKTFKEGMEETVAFYRGS